MNWGMPAAFCLGTGHHGIATGQLHRTNLCKDETTTRIPLTPHRLLQLSDELAQPKQDPEPHPKTHGLLDFSRRRRSCCHLRPQVDHRRALCFRWPGRPSWAAAGEEAPLGFQRDTDQYILGRWGFQPWKHQCWRSSSLLWAVHAFSQIGSFPLPNGPTSTCVCAWVVLRLASTGG